MIPRPPRRRLARRLLTGQVLVIAAGSVTLAVVAVVVSPALFHLHVDRALGPVSESLAGHLDEAFATSMLLSLTLGTGAAIVAAFAVSWWLSSRMARPIESLSEAAEAIANGQLDVRAPSPAADDELADLTVVFNDMADSLEHTEETRRRLLSDLAHELRTPLATLEGYHEGLADGVVDPDPETWAVLQDASSRLRRLVEDVALVSRAEEGRLELEPEQVDLAETVQAAVSRVTAPATTKGVTIEVDVDGAPTTALADPGRLGQVLDNLLGNALRHTPAGGRITVTGGPTADGGVVVSVSDTGEGIPGDALAHVFERFYRADPARTNGAGSGIGLTISRAIARAHGGELTVDSAGPGAGATFELTLPATDDRPGTTRDPRRSRR